MERLGKEMQWRNRGLGELVGTNNHGAGVFGRWLRLQNNRTKSVIKSKPSFKMNLASMSI